MRKQIVLPLKILVLVLVLDFMVPLIAGGAFYVASQSSSKSQEANLRAQNAQYAQYAACEVGNSYRTDQIKLWTEVVALIDGSTRAGKLFDTEVLALAKEFNASRVCPQPSPST